MIKHTPGPWHHSEHQRAGTPDGIFDAKGRCVAFGIATPQPFVVSGEDLANARLIASAPELLSELHRWVEATNGYRLEERAKAGEELTALEWETLNRRYTAREAIAKATGENSGAAQNG
jgi:hypothetical protein